MANANGEVNPGIIDPTARLVSTAEWVDPYGYSDLTAEQQEVLMGQVEPPPPVVQTEN